MKEIPLYDPNRSPPDWPGTLTQTQVAVLFSHATAGVAVTPKGEPVARGGKATCAVFDTLTEAEQYCRELCELNRTVRCKIFDHRGKSAPPLATLFNPLTKNAPNRLTKIRRMRIAAACLMSLSIPLCAWDGYRDWVLIMPTFLGINCFVISLRLFHWTKMELEATGRRQTPSDR